MAQYLYHGTSSVFAEDILKNGFKAADLTDKYAEIRSVFAKYIKPEILTDDFFADYGSVFSFKTVSSINLRLSQTQEHEAIGPFGCRLELFLGDNRYGPAPEYAHAITRNGAGELETGVVGYLNTLEERLAGLEEKRLQHQIISAKEYEAVKLLIENARPEFRNNDGQLEFKIREKDDRGIPVLFKIKVDSADEITGTTIDSRVKRKVGPEDIVGVAFLPLFDTRTVPVLEFLPKEQFLEELHKKQEGGLLTEDYTVRDNKTQCINYSLSFPDDKTVLEQKFNEGENLRESTLYAREDLINKGRLCRKRFNDGKLAECTLYVDDYPKYIMQFNDKEQIVSADVYQGNEVSERYFYKDGLPEEKFVFGETGINRFENCIPAEIFTKMIPQTEFEIDTSVDIRVAKIREKLQEKDIYGLDLSYRRLARIDNLSRKSDREIEDDLTKKKIGSIAENIAYMKGLRSKVVKD